MSRRLKIGILGSKGTTLDLIEGLVAAAPDEASIAAVFSLNDGSAARNRVAYLQGEEIRAACEAHGFPFTLLQSYGLTHEEDVAAISAADLDILCVIGWERLLPDRVLALPKLFVCGMHGSPYGLPRGRGRSPMNWSLIQGQKHFTTSLFRYAPGTDDGDVIGSRTFEINDHDTVQTLHMKNRIIMQELLLRSFAAAVAGKLTFTPQPDVPPSYYPKRVPEDGVLDWSASTQDLHRHIRALAPPYPPAFCYIGEAKLTVEAAQPFDMALFPVSAKPGQIVDVSPSAQAFVVKTGDGSILVTKFSGSDMDTIRSGTMLKGEPTPLTIDVLRQRYGPAIPEHEWEVGAAWLGLRQAG